MTVRMIHADRLAKAYRLGRRADRADTLFGALRGALLAPLRGFRELRRLDTSGAPAGRDEERLFWALQDVSFEVQEGDVVGILGRNGAGKSTLLKVLSRITEPTAGNATIEGRVASLLEVGTGFHPELTGRENVYMNGTLLGMSKAEIERQFDQIVDFSGVETFLDTPIKRYSSGMQVRLAFAVAAHLDPEVLVIDEVLAVGDAQFQKKCLGKMREVASGGRTVLFVSHKMDSISRLCTRGMVLHQGRLVYDGTVEDAITRYLENVAHPEQRWEPAVGNEVVRLQAARVVDPHGMVRAEHSIADPVAVEVDYVVRQGGHVLVPNLHFFSADGTCLFVSHDLDPRWNDAPRPQGGYTTRVVIPGDFLNEGEINVAVAVTSYHPFHVHVHERDAVGFRIAESQGPSRARGPYAGHVPGAVRPVFAWSTQDHA